MTAAVSIRLSAVSKPEFPLPMISTRWFVKSRGFTDTVVYTSAFSMPGIGGIYGSGTPVATMRRWAS